MFLPLALMVQIMQISGELNSQCNRSFECRARNGSGECCIKYRTGGKWRCPRSCSGSGYSIFNPVTRRFDDNTAEKIERKHFCETCYDESDAAAFSIARNEYCRDNGCQEARTNTVFVASFPNQQGNWYVTTGGKIYSQDSFDTYNCRNVPTTQTPNPPGEIYCERKLQCYAGPFNRNNGHLVWEKVDQWC